MACTRRVRERLYNTVQQTCKNAVEVIGKSPQFLSKTGSTIYTMGARIGTFFKETPSEIIIFFDNDAVDLTPMGGHGL